MGAVLDIHTGMGRPKQPREKRRVLSDKPDKNRISPPDSPMGETLGMIEVPEKPPINLGRYERECWRMITESQRGVHNSKWIYRSDCPMLLAACGFYARWRQLRAQIDGQYKEWGGHINPKTGDANPLLRAESTALSRYQAVLTALGMSPTRRQVTLSEKAQGRGSVDDEMLA